MRKVIYSLLILASLSILSCSSSDDSTSKRKAIGPTSDESDMPWNRPMGPEGAGALGILDQR